MPNHAKNIELSTPVSIRITPYSCSRSQIKLSTIRLGMAFWVSKGVIVSAYTPAAATAGIMWSSLAECFARAAVRNTVAMYGTLINNTPAPGLLTMLPIVCSNQSGRAVPVSESCISIAALSTKNDNDPLLLRKKCSVTGARINVATIATSIVVMIARKDSCHCYRNTIVEPRCSPSSVARPERSSST